MNLTSDLRLVQRLRMLGVIRSLRNPTTCHSMSTTLFLPFVSRMVNLWGRNSSVEIAKSSQWGLEVQEKFSFFTALCACSAVHPADYAMEATSREQRDRSVGTTACRLPGQDCVELHLTSLNLSLYCGLASFNLNQTIASASLISGVS
jgi:hypothetical protein